MVRPFLFRWQRTQNFVNYLSRVAPKVIFRCLFLYVIGITAFLRKIRFDLAHELVVGISAAVLGALFYYVFNDFVNHEVATLSFAMRAAFAKVLAWLLLIGATILTSRGWIGELTDTRAIGAFAPWLGENLTTGRCFLTLRCVSIGGLWYGAAWLVIRGMDLIAWTFGLQVSLAACATLATASSFYLRRKSPPPKEVRGDLRQKGDQSPHAVRTGRGANYALVNWRFELTARRLRGSRLSLLLSFLALGFLGLLAFRSAPETAEVAVAFVCGSFLNSALALAIASDLPATWIEKTCGIDHDQFARAWQQIAWGLGIGVGLLVTAVTLSPHLLRMDASWHLLSFCIKLGTVAALPALIFPSLMLQIDGRKPIAQMMAMLLVGMFLGTAVYANWAGILLIPIIHSYGKGLQRGRFYRA